MNNNDFLACIKTSFIRFLETGSRSNEKLVILHGFIAQDLAQRLGCQYQVKSLGIGSGQEGKIEGRYIDKNVDITVYNQQNEPIVGIGVKFVMQNYVQNSNNYFENMLGETANIQSKHIPYFQIFIVPEILPYYESSRQIKRWETFTLHHAQKYIKLSNDNTEIMLHSPAKTLFYLLNIPLPDLYGKTQEEYKKYYLNNDFNITPSHTLDQTLFGKNIILNDYETFIAKVVHRTLSL